MTKAIYFDESMDKWAISAKKPHIYFNNGKWYVKHNNASVYLFGKAMDFAVKLQDARNV